MKSKKKSNYKQIIQKIQNVRKKNNNNWMDILRLAFTYAPEESRELMKKVNAEDERISALLKELSAE